METNKDYSVEAMLAMRNLFADLVDDADEEILFGKRKSTSEEQMQKFLLVTAPVRWSDRGAYQKTTLRVNCFVRERANGVLPIDKIGALTNAVMAKFPYKTERFSFINPTLIHNCVGDGLGFGYSTLHIDVKVFTTDRYKNVEEDTETQNNNS